jgi:hypothetical protein
MGFDQYHEPPNELSQETRTFARMITSLIEEAEAISWYEQRMAVEKDKFLGRRNRISRHVRQSDMIAGGRLLSLFPRGSQPRPARAATLD